MNSPLLFHPLTRHVDGDEVIVGRTDGTAYTVLPLDGAALLDQLVRGATPDEAALWYEKNFGDPVDMAAFVGDLGDLGLLRTGTGEAPSSHKPRWQGLGRAVFSLPAALVWAALITGAALLCTMSPGLVPAQRDVFFSRSLLLVEVGIVILQLPLTLLHELGHLLAGRRLGVPCTLRVSHRATIVVFETVLDGLAVVPRRQRYLPLAAGMLVDLLVMAVLIETAWILGRVSPAAHTARLLCLALAFTTLPRIAFQFWAFLRTDVYFLLVTALRCDDLDQAGRSLLRTGWSRLRRRPADRTPDRLSPHDQRAARLFAPVLVGGYVVMAVTLLGVMLPLMVSMVTRVVTGVHQGGMRRTDAVAVLALNLAQPAVARILARRDRRRAADSTAILTSSAGG